MCEKLKGSELLVFRNIEQQRTFLQTVPIHPRVPIHPILRYIRNKWELRRFLIQEYVKCFYDNIKTILELQKVLFYQL